MSGKDDFSVHKEDIESLWGWLNAYHQGWVQFHLAHVRAIKAEIMRREADNA